MLFYPLTLSNIWQLLKGPQVHNPQFENHCPNTFRTHHRPLDLEAIGKNPKGTFDEVLATYFFIILYGLNKGVFDKVGVCPFYWVESQYDCC